MDLSNIVAVSSNISSLTSFLGTSKKREHPDFMDTKEVDTSSTPRKQKTKQEGQQVKKSNMKGKKKQEQPKLTSLELQ